MATLEKKGTTHLTFQSFAAAIAESVGTYRAFFVAMALVVAWAVSGPLFHSSDSGSSKLAQSKKPRTWVLVLGTGDEPVGELEKFFNMAC
jgi:hypothetical protein